MKKKISLVSDGLSSLQPKHQVTLKLQVHYMDKKKVMHVAMENKLKQHHLCTVDMKRNSRYQKATETKN